MQRLNSWVYIDMIHVSMPDRNTWIGVTCDRRMDSAEQIPRRGGGGGGSIYKTDLTHSGQRGLVFAIILKFISLCKLTYKY